MVVLRGVVRRHHERVLGRDAERDGVAHHRVDVPVLGDVLRLAVVGAERETIRSVLGDERQQRAQVARRGCLADEQPHAGTQPLASFVERRGLVVGAHTGRGVGLEIPPVDARRVPVDVRRERELRELALVPGHDAGKVHHLGDAEHAAAAQERLQIALAQRAARRLVVRRRHRRRSHEVHVERIAGRCVEQPVHAVRAEHVGDLVRVGDDRSRPERQHEARELVGEQLRRLEVDVRVDEPRHDVAARRVDDLGAVVLAEPCDPAVRHGDVDLEPLAREHREDAAAAHDHVRRLVAAGDGKASGELQGHRLASDSKRRAGRPASRPAFPARYRGALRRRTAPSCSWRCYRRSAEQGRCSGT